VKDLDEATAPRDRPPGSIAGLIDGLVHERQGRSWEFWWSASAVDPATPCGKVARLGFEAVPYLIEALEDVRITRSTSRQWRRPRMRVRDLASDLLMRISAGEIPRGRQEPVTRADATRWWLKAQLVGEEEYAAAHVLAVPGKVVQGHQIAVLAARYPRRLPAAYRQILKETKGGADDADALAEAVARADALPREQRAALLREGAAHADLGYRFDAVRMMLFHGLDGEAARRAIARTFLECPAEAGDGWRDGAWRFIPFVARMAGDDLVWKACEQAVRRAEPALRMEMLHALAVTPRPDRPAAAPRADVPRGLPRGQGRPREAAGRGAGRAGFPRADGAGPGGAGDGRVARRGRGAGPGGATGGGARGVGPRAAGTVTSEGGTRHAGTQ
jgi:hypothetical protein